MPAKNFRLIVFAKAPIQGLAKTRLAAHVGTERATQIHRQLVLHTLETAMRNISCAIELWCAPDRDHEFFQACRQRYHLSLHTQQGKGLGERMSHAFATALTQNDGTVMIGTDCPLLDGTHLKLAFDGLARGHDAVITPADDGGYVLLGLSRYTPDLFRGIAWGTSTVYQDTIDRLARQQWSWHALGRLWDIDTAADLERLLALKNQPIPARLQNLIENLSTSLR